MSGSYNNRNRGRGGNRPYNNQNNKNRRTHDYHQQVQQQPSSSNNNSQELNNGVYANERFMHTTMALIGAIAKVTVKSGKVYEGVFKTFSPRFEVVLEKVHEVDLNDPTGIPFREEIKPQMVFKLDDIAAVVYVNVDPFFAIADGFTDAAISRKANGQAGEKELQPWVSDTNPEEALDDVDILEGGKSNGWDAMDMFRTNRDKFQIESTYDPNMGQYTTPLPAHNTEEFKTYEENAAMVAREIESSLNYKQRVELENTKDEETLHSAVVRESQSSKNQQRQRQDGGQHSERSIHCGPRVNKTYTSSGMTNSSSIREASPSRQQPQKTGPSAQSDLMSTPHSNYSDAVAKKHLTSSIQNHSQQGHHHAATAGSSLAGQADFTSSAPSSASGSLSTLASSVNGFKHHVLPEQSQAQSMEWKAHHPTGTGSGSYGGGGAHQQQSDVVSSHHHHSQQPAHHKDATIKDLKEFQNNFNLTDMSQLPVSQQPASVQASISAIESIHIQPVASASASQPASECVASSIPSAATTPTSSKSLTTSNGSLSTDASNTEASEKKKEVTYTLNPNANEFRPRNASAASVDSAMGQVLQPLQAMPAANIAQQQSAQAHLQTHKAAQMSGNQAQAQQLVPSTVASPPIMYSNPAVQQFAVAPHMPPGPIFYCPSAVTPRYSGGNKRATVSARGNSEVATPQATNLMAGPPLISQNGLPQMFITPQQMMNFSSYNQLRLMTPVILEHVPHNPMLLSTPMIPPLPAPPHGTPTAVMHPLLQQQQQQIVAQQQQPSNNSNGGGRPNSNGSGAPTPVHYHPMPQQGQGHNQGVGHHQQQQQQQQTPTQIYHGTPSASLALQAHAPQQMTVPSGSQMPNSMQSQMLFSPFIPTFANHHPQSAGFTAAMPPPAISGTLQGQVPPGALHHHQLVQHPQFPPMIIASQNQQVAAQLGQFVTVPGLPQGPPNIASPQLLYGMPPTIQPSMSGQNFQHGQ